MAAAVTMLGHDDAIDCPKCGARIRRALLERREVGDVLAVVIVDPGNAYSHTRDEHPALWAQLCAEQRAWNARGLGMPRKVDGSLLFAGEDVGDTA